MRAPSKKEKIGLKLLRQIVRTTDELPITIDTDALPARDKERLKAAMNWIDAVADARPRSEIF